MSAEAATIRVPAVPSAGSARAAALRLAFGVTCCFAVVEGLDWDATFLAPMLAAQMLVKLQRPPSLAQGLGLVVLIVRSEEHTSELQSLMRISYAVSCLKKKIS